MKKLIPFMFIAFLMTAGLSANSQTTDVKPDASKSCCKKGDKSNGCMQNIPDLTEQQVQKIEGLCLGTKKEMMGIKNQLAEKQAHLKTLQDVDKPDMTAINKTIDEISLLKADMMKKHAATRQSVRELLTEKQRIVFDAKPMGGCHGGEGAEKCGKHGGEGKAAALVEAKVNINAVVKMVANINVVAINVVAINNIFDIF
jgi:Spy/CpxP family protein refolding chaperone